MDTEEAARPPLMGSRIVDYDGHSLADIVVNVAQMLPVLIGTISHQ